MVIVYYSGRLMYLNLCGDKNLDFHKDVVMSVSVKNSQVEAEHISDDRKANGGEIHHTWITPVVFNPQRFINILCIWKVIGLFGLLKT